MIRRAQPAAAGLLARVRQVVLVLRLRPFDDSTEAGRSLERYRRAALSTLVAFWGKGVGIIATLATVSLTLSYLGAERYGMWMTISSVIAIISFMDLGVGASIIGAVSRANAEGKAEEARQFVASGLFVFFLLISSALLVFAAVYPFVSWGRAFNVRGEQAIAEAGPAIAMVAVCQGVTFLLALVGNVRIALQEGYVNALWGSLGSVLSLAGALIAIRLHATLPNLVLSVSGPPLIAAAANAIAMFTRGHPELRPRWSAVRWPAMRHLFRLGTLFIILQFSSALAFSSDNVVAAQVLGADAVAGYSVPFRLMMLPMIAVTLLLGPLWPAYTDAITRGDAAWVRRTFVRSLRIAITFNTLASLALLVFANAILRAWVGPGIQASFMLLLGLAIWNVFSAVGTATSMLFNGAHVFRFQVWTCMSMAILNIVLSVVLARAFGLAGIIWGTVIAYFACCIVPWCVFVPRLLAGINPPSADAPTTPPPGGAT